MSNIHDILLCSFDITNGNVIEYSINQHFTSENSNISFKAMPDNCHTLDSLYNIININDIYYGISYFKKIKTDDIAQRNSVYKSLIIVTNQLNLTLILKDKLKLTMDLILNDENNAEKLDVEDLLNSLYSNLNMIYKDEVYLDYIDNQLVEYNLEKFLNICKEIDILALFKLMLLEKRVVLFTEDISLLEDLVFLQIALFSLYPNLLNQFTSSNSDDEENNLTDKNSFNVLDIMSKYNFLKLPLQFLKKKSSWSPYLTIDEVDGFINPENKNRSFLIGLGSGLFLNHKQAALAASKKQASLEKNEDNETNNDDNDKQIKGDEDSEKSVVTQKKRVAANQFEQEIESVHYDVAYKLVSNGVNKLPKLEIDYWSHKLSKECIRSSAQDIRFMNILFKESGKLESTIAKDRFIRKQFENYLIDLLFFIKLYYYKEFVKLTSLDYDELKEQKIKRGETPIEKNTRKVQLKSLQMILSESEHSKIDFNIKKQFEAFGGKPFFKNWFHTANYKIFMQTTDDRLFDIEMNEDFEFVITKDFGIDNKWDCLLDTRFWCVEHPVYNLETIIAKREEELGGQWRLALPEIKLPEVKLPEMKLPDLRYINLTDVNSMIPQVKIADMMYWKGGFFQQNKKVEVKDKPTPKEIEDVQFEDKEGTTVKQENEATVAKEIDAPTVEEKSKVPEPVATDSTKSPGLMAVVKNTFFATPNSSVKEDQL